VWVLAIRKKQPQLNFSDGGTGKRIMMKQQGIKAKFQSGFMCIFNNSFDIRFTFIVHCLWGMMMERSSFFNDQARIVDLRSSGVFL
jgi:hypothetical protein